LQPTGGTKSSTAHESVVAGKTQNIDNQTTGTSQATKSTQNPLTQQKSTSAPTHDGVPEFEFKSGKAAPPKKVIDLWKGFLGEGYSDINPWNGQKEKDRLWSKDGHRSIRHGEHEMEYSHFHYENWGRDNETGEVRRLNVYQHIQK
jgi:hypothetical protein